MPPEEPGASGVSIAGMVLLLTIIGFVFGVGMCLFGLQIGQQVGGGIMAGLSLVAAALLFR
jgi:hypothetical protein